MAYLDYPGLAYFKSLLDQTYLRVDYDGDTTIAGHVTFTNPITGDIDGRAKKDWLGQQFDTTYLKDIQPDESGALKLILGNGQVSHLVTDTTVTQERSSANETYPILLCYDENATADQIAKKVKYGHDVQINPAYGYIYAQGYTEKHPAYNRTTAQSSRVEWMLDFRDSVLNPVGQIYSYIDPSSQGGEHRMEFRLYGNPHTASLDLPNYNFETDTVSLGVSSTKGDKLTFFGYAPSTPIYLENGSTMRKSTVRGDQYGRDIITRDWLNLNGSITGLVHTYMDETIDGLKTFLKTVTIDSGDANNKAGLYVQGDANLHSNVHVYGNEDIDGNLNVDGTSDQHGNVHMYHNLDVDGNANTDGNQTIGGTLTVTGKITGNGGAEISGGSGLKVNGTTTTTNLSVTDDATIGDDLTVNGDELVKGNETVNGNSNVGGTINKVSGNTTTEYVQYITNQPANRENIAANLIDGSKGLYLTSAGKIGVELQNQGGLKFDSNGGLYVDFSGATDDVKDAIMGSLGIQIPLTSNKTLYVNKNSSAATDAWRNSQGVIDKTVGSQNKPFKTIQAAVNCAASGYSIGSNHITIRIVKGNTAYAESISLPQLAKSSGYVELVSDNESTRSVLVNPSPTSNIITCTGDGWRIVNLEINNTVSNPNDGISHYPGCVSASGAGNITVMGCRITASYSGSAPNGNTNIRMISAGNGGTVRMSLHSSFQPSIVATKGNSTGLVVFYTEQNGSIVFGSTNDGDSNSSWHNIQCSGNGDHFLAARKYGSITNQGGAAYHAVCTGTFSGSKCTAYEAGSISITSAGCPGDSAGTCNTNQASWVTPASLLE